MKLELEDKIVFISASTSGIGLAIAKGFLQEGAKIIINGRNREKSQSTAGKLSHEYGKSRVDLFVGDLTQESECERLADMIKKKYGYLDILVSNLGSGKPQAENWLDKNELLRFLDINFVSPANVLNWLIPCLKKNSDSSVAVISSIAGIEINKAPYGYCAAKSAIISLVGNLSLCLANDNIRINCIAPGNVFFTGGRWEEKLEEDREGIEKYIAESVPLNRFAKPEEIADAVVFLCSKRSAFTTGTVLVVDGGETRSIK